MSKTDEIQKLGELLPALIKMLERYEAENPPAIHPVDL